MPGVQRLDLRTEGSGGVALDASVGTAGWQRPATGGTSPGWHEGRTQLSWQGRLTWAALFYRDTSAWRRKTRRLR
jgi:hypothetical protein